MQLHLRITALHQIACYSINEDGTDGCRVCFDEREVSVVGTAARLDGVIVCIGTVFTSDHKNCSMRRLFITIAGMLMQGLLNCKRLMIRLIN